MNCNCVDEIQKKAVGVVWNKRKILSANLKELVFAVDDKGVDMITCSHFEAQLEGKTTKQLITVNHIYCPFCGTKIGKQENLETSKLPDHVA